MAISKVKTVLANGTWDSQHGLLYKFDYTFEDGISIAANHKTQSHFQIGDEVEYEIKGTSDFGNRGSVGKVKEQFTPNTNFSGGKSDKVQTYIIRQSSLTRAIEHLSHKDHDKMTKENITALAEYYANWVLQ